MEERSLNRISVVETRCDRGMVKFSGWDFELPPT